jgi:Protein of unknown function (DUF1194)
VIRRAVALVVVAILATPGLADCRLALAIGLDVSRSVDRREDGLQIEGLARALLAPDVQQAFLAQTGRHVAFAVYDWSGARDQRVLLDWVEVNDAATLAGIAAVLRSDPRTTGRNRTAIGSGIAYGLRLLATSPDCAAHTLDLTGDGFSNDGPLPGSVGSPGGPHAVTINALVIAPLSGQGEDPRIDQIARYFETRVIRGTGAFVERAVGFEDFREAMERKLLRELGFGAFSGGTRSGPIRFALAPSPQGVP